MKSIKKQIILLLTVFLLFVSACGPIDPAALNRNMTNGYQADIRATETTRTTSKTTQAAVTATTSSQTNRPTSTPTPQVEPTLPDLQGISLQYWYPWSGMTAKTLEDLVNQFNSENEWGIQVIATSTGNLGDLAEKVKAAQAEGQLPDILNAYLYQVLDWDIETPVGLNNLINDPVLGISEAEQADFFPFFWQTNRIDDDYLGAPFLGFGQLLFYNQSWAEELGFSDPPATPQQLRQQACQATLANQQDDNPNNDTSGGLILSTHYSPILGWIGGFGGSVFDSQGTQSAQGPYRFNTPQVKQAFNFLRELYDQGCAWLPDEPYPEEEFATRQGLLVTGSISNLPYQGQVMAQAGSADQWTVIPFPSPDDKPAIDLYSPSSIILTDDPEHQIAAWLFVKWLLTPENQARLAASASAFPTRKSAVEHLQEFQNPSPQWAAAIRLLENGVPEPNLRSWNLVRWALSDASTQLFRSYFTIDQVPDLAAFLDKTAKDLHLNTPPSAK